MSETSGIGQEPGISNVNVAPKPGLFSRLIQVARGGKPQNTQSPPPPVATPSSNEALQGIVQGIQDPATGEIRSPDASWKGPGIGQNDNRLMGEQRATSPGNEFLKANEAGTKMPEIPATKPTYIAQGTEQDSQPLASASQEPAVATISSLPESPAIASATGSTSVAETAPASNPTQIPETATNNVIQFPKTPQEPAA